MKSDRLLGLGNQPCRELRLEGHEDAYRKS